MAENFNDAGRRVKLATQASTRADREAARGDAQITSAKLEQARFQALQAKMAADPELAALLKASHQHIMFPDIVNGMDPAKAMQISPEGSGEGEDLKIRSIDDLKKASAIANGQD